MDSGLSARRNFTGRKSPVESDGIKWHQSAFDLERGTPPNQALGASAWQVSLPVWVLLPGRLRQPLGFPTRGIRTGWRDRRTHCHNFHFINRGFLNLHFKLRFDLENINCSSGRNWLAFPFKKKENGVSK